MFSSLFCRVPASRRLRGTGVVTALKAAAIATLVCAAMAPALAQGTGSMLQPEVKSEFMPTYLGKPVAVPGALMIPASSQIKAADLGKRAHTNVSFIVPAVEAPYATPPETGFEYETPASLACLYHIVTPVTGCNPNTVTANPTGGSQTIAIVDAYDDPEAPADLAYFSAQFGLPFTPADFNVVYADGYAPDLDDSGGWELEESLDVEYAHAMAPKAKLYLVEAASNSNYDLITAVQVASNLVACGETTTCPTGATGKGEISMSWGEEEFSGENTYDSSFTYPITTAHLVYIASSGDSPGPEYPCASPNVVCAGGTTIARSQTTGDFLKEIAWSDAGGGESVYETIPSYQSAVSSVVGKQRGVPDLSFDSNPNTGVWVYDSFPVFLYDYGNPWMIVGGTSVAAQTVAGIINAAGGFHSSSAGELSTIYADRAVATDFNDITYGYCGYYSGSLSVTGYDLCTGVGSPYGLTGK